MKKTEHEKNLLIYKNTTAMFFSAIGSSYRKLTNKEVYNILIKICNKYKAFLSSGKHLKKEKNLALRMQSTIEHMQYVLNDDSLFNITSLITILECYAQQIYQHYYYLDSDTQDKLRINISKILSRYLDEDNIRTVNAILQIDYIL